MYRRQDLIGTGVPSQNTDTTRLLCALILFVFDLQGAQYRLSLYCNMYSPTFSMSLTNLDDGFTIVNHVKVEGSQDTCKVVSSVRIVCSVFSSTSMVLPSRGQHRVLLNCDIQTSTLHSRRAAVAIPLGRVPSRLRFA